MYDIIMMCVIAVLVALKNREVRVYRERFLVNTIILEVRTNTEECHSQIIDVECTCAYVL